MNFEILLVSLFKLGSQHVSVLFIVFVVVYISPFTFCFAIAILVLLVELSTLWFVSTQ